MDNNAREFFLSVLDQASCIISSDPLAEQNEISEYMIQTAKPSSNVIADKPVLDEKEAARDCHRCNKWQNRRMYASPTLHSRPLILFIVPYPEGDRMFSPESQDYFYKWQKALHLEPGEIALSSIMRCPSAAFEPASADLCKSYLRDEMAELEPQNLVILSEAASRYMTRSRDDWSSMRRGRMFSINRIPSYCCISPSDLVADPALKRDAWEDLKAIARAIGIGNRL